MERQIARLIAIVDRHLRLGVYGAVLFAGESFKNDLISAVNMRSYDG